MTGVGGGSLMTPLLVVLFGFHPATAVGTDLLYASVTKSVGTVVHGKRQTVDWKIVGGLASGSVPASIVTLSLMGSVPQDEWLKRAVRRQRAVVDAYPNSPSAKAFRELAKKADRWIMPQGPRGNLEFFVERLMQPQAGLLA